MPGPKPTSIQSLYSGQGHMDFSSLWLDIAMVFPWGWALTGLIVCSVIGIGFVFFNVAVQNLAGTLGSRWQAELIVGL